MKKIFLSLILFSMSSILHAQQSEDIRLNEPNKRGGLTVQEALANRRSYRGGIDSRALSLQQLSDLLWAANGVNRPNGGRTAPSAIGAKDVDVYVILPQAAYLYEPEANQLRWIAGGDYRKAAGGGQEFVETVPVVLILVSDLERFGSNLPRETIETFAAIDTGIVSQNISVFCAGNGLATIPRYMMDQEVLRNVLKLKDSQRLLLNNAVGFPTE